MNFFTFPIIVMSAAVVIALLVGWYALRWRTSPGGSYFIWLMITVAIFAFTGAAEQAVSSVSAKIIWSKLSYIGIVTIAPLWFLFTESYGQRSSKMTRTRITVLWLLPMVIFGLAVTNEWHRLIWPKITIVSSSSSSRLVYSHGIGFWVHTVFAYILLIAGTYLLVRVAWRSPKVFRWQAIALLAAAFIPWLANLLYLLNINPWPGLDLTPLGFVLSGLIISWALFRLQVLDLVPVARDVLFESIGDGVIVLDKWNRITDLNPIAREWMGVGDEAIGSHVRDVVLPEDVIDTYEDVMETQNRLEIGEGESRSIFDLTISPLRDAQGTVHGRIVLLHDISREHHLLESEQLRSRQMELLNTITQVSLSMSDLTQMLQELVDRFGELFRADGVFLTLWNEDQQRAIPAAAYGNLRDEYASMLPNPNEQSITETALTTGHALAIDDVYNTPYLSSHSAAFYPTRSLLALPLIVSNQKLGAVIISFNQTHHFVPDEVELGEQAARQIALGMIKIKLYKTEKKRAAQLAALQTVSQVVVSSLDLNRIFETVVQVLKETFGYHFVSIYHLEGETLRLGTQVGSPDDMIFEEISLDQGVSGRAVRTRQPQFIPDVEADPDYLRINANIGTEICVPLIKEQTVFGTLNVEASAQHPLAESDVTLLTTFANQVAVAIDNARLFKAEREQHDLADALRDVGMALSESLDFETVLERLLDEIQDVVPYDRAFVLLLDRKRAHASIARVRVLEQFRKETGSLKLKLELDLSKMANFREMLKTRKPLVIPNTKNNPIWTKTSALTPVRSWVGAPISYQNQVTGFLSLDSLKTNFYKPEHADRLAMFARQTAVSIENARLFTETQQQAHKERLLFMATRDFTARLGEDAVLQAIVRHMTSAFELGGCAISRWDQEKDHVTTLLDYMPSTGVLLENPRITYPLDDYPQTRFVIESQQSLSMHVNESSIDPNEYALLKEFGNDSLLMLPVVIGQGKQVFGIVELFGKIDCSPFTEEEIELAESLVAQAATAIENARLYSEVQRLAIIDELTGLYNRRGFLKIGEREWERSIRLKRPLAALFLDIDYFKQFNDKYSYAVGDQVLRLLADCLRDNLRKVDIAGRYGGEEFVVLLPETGLHAAMDVAERLRTATNSARVKTDLDEVSITVSIGICQKTPDLIDLYELIERAGQALKHAKNTGRNRVIISHSIASSQGDNGNSEIHSVPDTPSKQRVE